MIGEASLPDVDSGNFIHSPATAAEHFREYGAAPIDGEPIALVFASDGGAICVRDRSQRTNLEVHHGLLV